MPHRIYVSRSYRTEEREQERKKSARQYNVKSTCKKGAEKKVNGINTLLSREGRPLYEEVGWLRTEDVESAGGKQCRMPDYSHDRCTAYVDENVRVYRRVVAPMDRGTTTHKLHQGGSEKDKNKQPRYRY